jgi:hypothetical protein
MKNSPSPISSKESEKKISDILGSIDKSRPLLTASAVALSPAFFLFFVAMAFPSYSIAKVFELAARDTVKYPGQLNSYVKDQSQFAGGITGIVEFFAGMGVKKFKDFVGMIAEFIPAEERPEINPDEVEKLYKGMLCYDARDQMVPAGKVKPFSATNVSAQSQAEDQLTSLHC